MPPISLRIASIISAPGRPTSTMNLLDTEGTYLKLCLSRNERTSVRTPAMILRRSVTRLLDFRLAVAPAIPVTGSAPAWVLAYLVGAVVAVGAVLLALMLSRHDRRVAARAEALIEAVSLDQAPVADLEQAP